MSEAINPGDRVEVEGGRFDGLRGVLSIGRAPLDLLPGDHRGRLIVIRGEDYKSYPMSIYDFRELRKIGKTGEVEG